MKRNKKVLLPTTRNEYNETFNAKEENIFGLSLRTDSLWVNTVVNNVLIIIVVIRLQQVKLIFGQAKAETQFDSEFVTYDLVVQCDGFDSIIVVSCKNTYLLLELDNLKRIKSTRGAYLIVLLVLIHAINVGEIKCEK